MGLALDVDTDVAFGIGGGRSDIAIVVGMDYYSLGNQRSCVPQLRAVCLAIDYHSFDRIHHDAILDVPAGVYVFGTQIKQTRRNEVIKNFELWQRFILFSLVILFSQY